MKTLINKKMMIRIKIIKVTINNNQIHKIRINSITNKGHLSIYNHRLIIQI